MLNWVVSFFLYSYWKIIVVTVHHICFRLWTICPLKPCTSSTKVNVTLWLLTWMCWCYTVYSGGYSYQPECVDVTHSNCREGNTVCVLNWHGHRRVELKINLSSVGNLVHEQNHRCGDAHNPYQPVKYRVTRSRNESVKSFTRCIQLLPKYCEQPVQIVTDTKL